MDLERLQMVRAAASFPPNEPHQVLQSRADRKLVLAARRTIKVLHTKDTGL